MTNPDWRQPFSSLAPGQPQTLGDVAMRSDFVPGDKTGEELDALFHARPELMSFVMRDQGDAGRLATISRLDFYREMSGRLGFGHALHSKRPVRDIATWDPLQLPAEMPIDQATAAVLGRGDHRYEDVVVRWPDGEVGTANPAALFEALAGLYGHQAMHDPLTGLPNRVLLADRVQHALDGRERDGRGVAVLFVDIDDFKTINDSLGHLVGDQLLVMFGRRLQSLIRPSDTMARLGGDEFALLMTGISTIEPAVAAARRITESLRMAFELDEELIHVVASVGVVFVNEQVTSAEAVLRDADIAMYSAKRRRQGSYQVFESVMQERISERRLLEKELRTGIEEDQFFLLFQPQLSLRSGACVALEALLRWNHPTRGTLYPDSFIPLAEQTGLILELDEWVLRRACSQTRFWSMKGRENLRVAVNISARNFENRELERLVAGVLGESGLDPTRLELEVTERLAVSEHGIAEDILREIRGMGVRVALDDFGTGHSALSRLIGFPLDVVKIDRSFIGRLELDARQRAIVSAIIELCHAVGLEAVAEGVETAGQLSFLRHIGCDSVQGFHIGQPMLPEAIEPGLASAEQASLTA